MNGLNHAAALREATGDFACIAKQLPCSFSFGMVRAISGQWGNRGGLEAGPWGALATGCRGFRSDSDPKFQILLTSEEIR
jgi:hypothetical protein